MTLLMVTQLFLLLVTNFVPSQSYQDGNLDRDLGGAPPLMTLYQWKVIDFEFGSAQNRSAAIASKNYIPENNLPLGIEVWKKSVIVTVPRWKPGVPVTLATVPRVPSPGITAPLLQPFPDWSWHQQPGDCSKLISVFRVNVDQCGRLWVLDSGQIEALTAPRQVCPPKIIAFDLNRDRVIGYWPIPNKYVLQNSLFTNILADTREDKCEDVHVYFTDVWRYGLLVFRLRDEKFWKFSNHLFLPDPLACDYTLHGVNFQWTDGIFGISMSPVDKYGERILYFHPMGSYREFQMPVSVLRNETAASDNPLLVKVIKVFGESRGIYGQSSTSAIDRNGVMFYTQILKDSLACWDIKKPYKKVTQGVVAKDNEKLVYLNDLKVDKEAKQSVWVLSNKLPIFIYSSLNTSDINFRILRQYVSKAVQGNICNPKTPYKERDGRRKKLECH